MTKLIINKINLKLATIIASTLSLILYLTANTASSFVWYDPKQPKTLDKFKKIK